jgi:hypothetical protein
VRIYTTQKWNNQITWIKLTIPILNHLETP